MTAPDVIEQIMALPPEEQAKVVEFIEDVRATQRGNDATERAFNEAATWAFTEHAELMRKLSQ